MQIRYFSISFLLSSVFCLLSSVFSFSQETKITGKVYDSQTREALPFVNIKYKGGKPFTTTDVDGNFSLITLTPSDSIEISYIGYKTKKLKVKKNSAQALSISLDPDQFTLNEVVILPGENPAHRILRKVIAHKDQNDKEKLSSFEYEVYNKIEFDMNNIPPEWKKKKVLKPIKFVFDYIDSTSVTEKPYLPLLLSETISEYFYKKNPRFRKEIITASKVSGVQDKSISQFMGEMYQNVNIYDNNILVFGKQFPSPISDNALNYYKFYLIDSVFVGNNRCYQLQFKPRRKQEFAFAGNLWIADTTFAVKRLDMSVPDDVNLNFVKALAVVQEYSQIKKDSLDEAGTWMLSRDRLVIDFKLDDNRKKPRQAGFYGRKTTSYKNFVINKPREDDFYNRTDNLVVQDSAELKDDKFWEKARHDTLSKNEKLIYHIVDTVKSMPIYRTWYNWIYIFVTGYKQFGKLEFGPYYKTYSYNDVEGHRFRAGFRTSDDFSRWVEFSGFGAYGTKDETFKYNLAFKSFITKKPRQIVYLDYKDDLEILGQSANAFTSDNIIATAFRRTPLNNMTSIQQSKIGYEWEPFPGFNTKLFLTNRVMTPKGIQSYKYVNDSNDTLSLNNIISSEAKAQIRFAYNEKYIEYTFARTSTGTRYPVVTLNYTYGAKNILKSDYEYHKLALNINDRFRTMPLLGYTDYIIEAGKIFGTVPYPLLELHGGNETVIYDAYAFNMMNYYEFGSDQYLTVQAFHHFDGFFLNHIPLMRKLKWREVISAKGLIGDITKENKNSLLFPGTLSSLNKKPYYEVSAGIENIFKVFRIDALWRLSYTDKEYKAAYALKSGGKHVPEFGIMWSLQITF
ncbi:MAG: carboxypeptidase-like regulatory domain-containing protein [Bacteroidetes bacterium]|nr:carboxypeptidase-like regulatory domain-containing protein [Bacteroidota bacterium]